MKRIVVGIDGSAASRKALHWALREAKAHGADVEAVHVWHYPYLAAGSFGPTVLAHDDFEADAKQLLNKAVDSSVTPGLDVRIERIVAQGHTARTLIDVAHGADLLVLGSRGLGGFTGLLLGSVSQQCLHHAPCPIVIIPHTTDNTVKGGAAV